MPKIDPKKRAQKAIEALDTLGVALADHDHKWSVQERSLYGRARTWLLSLADEA
jgi:hypothetical protein